MKVITVLGTRPEIIRLSRIIPLLDKYCEHVLVFTGQNFDPRLSDIFFEELGVRRPDHVLDTRADSAWAQIGSILAQTDRILAEEKPERFLVLGDTNSALTAQCAKRRNIRVYHMEAGNRCFDDRVPEEVNRRVVDHSSDVLMPYTERSRDNLLREGFHPANIYVTGNPIKEVLDYYAPRIEASDVLTRMELEQGGYFLATLHRSENVDSTLRLKDFWEGLMAVSRAYGRPVLLSLHPRTRDRLEPGLTGEHSGLRLIEPPGFFDFVRLEKHAAGILSDSGTVQEEACLFGIPNVTLRDVTERPETLECGSNILSGAAPDDILGRLAAVLDRPKAWRAPREYLEENVSFTVAGLITGFKA